MRVRSLDAVQPFITADGSEIRELAGRVSLPTVNQSLAEATIPVGGATIEHYHPVAEELYFITAGQGRLRIDGDEREVVAGDCAVIAPGAVHKLWNIGGVPLKLLCCCAPAYTHEDTVLTEGPPAA